MMSPDKNNLSPRMSLTGDAFFSPTFDREEEVVFFREPEILVLSDALEQALDSADETLSGLEADRKLLPSAILRKCHEFADGLGSLAEELENQSKEDRQLLVEAIHDDLRLLENTAEELHTEDGIVQLQQPKTDMDAILNAISGASTLLRDVEASFREIGNEEAEEIADAALIMARLFLLSVQNIHSTMVQQMDSKRETNTAWVEELNDDEANDENKPKRRNKHRRMRVLWPPLGPKVDGAMAWTKQEATKRPVLAVALGLTLWPVAISTALLGTSMYCIDGALQDTYNRFQDSSWISVAEESAAQAYQTGRLMVATGKLVGKQSLKVASLQIQRQGGIQPILCDLGGMVVDRITHPIDTVGKVWDGVHWSFGILKDATDEFWRMKKESSESLL